MPGAGVIARPSRVLRCNHVSGRAPSCVHNGFSRRVAIGSVAARATKKDEKEEQGIGLKAAWYGAEIFGKLVGDKKDTAGGSGRSEQASITWEQAKAGIRADYDENYFVSGAAAMDVYDPDCEFADPFVSFNGVDRFKENLSNFGKVTRDVQCSVTKWEEIDDLKLEVGWKFKCILDLPWKPVLAAAGSTTYIGDPKTSLVVKHIEAWDADPKEVVKRLLKPSNKIPQSEIEVFMASLSSGDTFGAWQVASGKVLLVCLPVVAASVICKVSTGEGLPGTFLGSIEGIAWLLAVVCIGTQGYKVVRDLTGGESG